MSSTILAGVAGIAAGALAMHQVLSPTPVVARAELRRPPPDADWSSRVRRWALIGNTPGLRATKEVRYVNELPANAREVPVVVPRRTPITGRRINGARRDDVLAFLDALRRELQRAGRGDEDVRCNALLYANETAWNNACYGWNGGNVKAQTTVFYPLRGRSIEQCADAISREQRVYTTNPTASEIFLLVDRVNSLDGYAGYETCEAFLRRQKDVTFGRNYPGVLSGYRRGGLEGLIEAERAMGGENPGRLIYSGAPAAARELQARAYWNRMNRLLGNSFTR